MAFSALLFTSSPSSLEVVNAIDKNHWRQKLLPELYSHDCDSWFHDAIVKPCVFGSADSEKTVVLIGDSIAAQWFVAIPRIFTQPDWRVVVLTKSSCPMVDVDFFYDRIGKQ